MSVSQAIFRKIIITGLCGLLALASGCSTLRIAYDAAPKLTYWWLDGYVDFNDAQVPRVHEALEKWFAWHRRSQLPDYAAQLALARTEVLVDTTPTRVCEWQTGLIKRARTAFDGALPIGAELVLTITPAQIKHIERQYAKFNDRFRDEYLQPDPVKRAEETLKRTLDRAETLYGKLDAAQRTRMSQALQRSPFDPEVWLTERRQRQQEALQILRTLTSDVDPRSAQAQAQTQAALRVYADHLERSPREAYRRYADRLSEFNCAFGADLHNSTTAAQRKTAAQKLEGWEGDLRSLAAVAPLR